MILSWLIFSARFLPSNWVSPKVQKWSPLGLNRVLNHQYSQTLLRPSPLAENTLQSHKCIVNFPFSFIQRVVQSFTGKPWSGERKNPDFSGILDSGSELTRPGNPNHSHCGWWELEFWLRLAHRTNGLMLSVHATGYVLKIPFKVLCICRNWVLPLSCWLMQQLNNNKTRLEWR